MAFLVAGKGKQATLDQILSGEQRRAGGAAEAGRPDHLVRGSRRRRKMGGLTEADGQKRAAAEAAVALVEDGMVLGLGTGSTMVFAVDALGAARARAGLAGARRPDLGRTEEQARALGIPLADFAAVSALDLAIDGADEVENGTLRLIKGLGGALLREKIVAEAARRFVVVADASKVVARLGERAPVPVEVVRFGHEVDGAAPRGLRGGAGAPFGLRRGAVRHGQRQPDL